MPKAKAKDLVEKMSKLTIKKKETAQSQIWKYINPELLKKAKKSSRQTLYRK